MSSSTRQPRRIRGNVKEAGMPKRSARHILARLSIRRRQLQDLHRRAEWASEARTAPTLRAWLNARAPQPAEEPDQAVPGPPGG
jgi:hypothetical protein